MDFDKIWEDLQGRFATVLDKSHVLFKYVALFAIAFLAFSLRVLGFVRVRGTHEVEDVFNLAMTDRLSSAGICNFFHTETTDGSVLYPGLMAFVNVTHFALRNVGIVITVQTLHTLAGPFFASCAALATYFLGKELKDEVTGLVAAGMLALLPGFFSLSVDGRNANIVGGTFFMILVVLFFLKAIRSQSLFHAFLAGTAYFMLSSFWSGYIFAQVLLSTYVVVLLLFDKCTTNVYTAFTVFFIVGNVLSVLLPTGGFLPFLHLEFFPGFAVFVLLQLEQYLKIRDSVTLIGGVMAILFAGAFALGILTPSPAFSIFLAQFASGNGSNWLTFFRDLHLVLFLFPAGVFLCFRKRTEGNIFFIVYAGLALVLASISGHFSCAFFPVAAVLSSLGLSTTFKTYLKNQDAPVKKAVSKPISKEINVAVIAGMAAIAGFFLVYSFSAATHPSVYQPTTMFPAISQSNNEFSWVDDLREAVSWLRHNTANDTMVVTWRGLGQQIASIGRQSVLGPDPAAPQHLGQVAKLFQADERNAAAAASELQARYVLIVFGGATGFHLDDLAHSHEMARDALFSDQSLLFKLSYKGFADLPTRPSDHPGFDLVRQHPVPYRPTLTHFAEAFTSEHWLVRIFEVTPPAGEEEETE